MMRVTTEVEQAWSEDPESFQDPSEFPGNYCRHVYDNGQSERSRIYYLDHAGATMFSSEQMQDVVNSISELQLNPHTSVETGTDSSQQARQLVLGFLNAPPGKYDVIFTSGATPSLRLLAESFDWHGSQFLYTSANHTSVLAMREVVHAQGGTVGAVRVSPTITGCKSHSKLRTVQPACTKPANQLHEHVPSRCTLALESASSARPVQATQQQQQPACVMQPPLQAATSASHSRVTVVALPAECNLTGLRCSDSTLHALCHGECLLTAPDGTEQALAQPLVLLDAAKACQTAPPDLSRHPVHFLALSFYKLFGYPTGLGALVVRRDTCHHLHPRFLGGGTVAHALPRTWPSATVPRPFPAPFEPGTPHFLGLRALPAGFAAWRKHARDRRGAQHACALAAQLARELSALQHGNGKPLCTVLGWPHVRGAGAGMLRQHVPKDQSNTRNGTSGSTMASPDSAWTLGIGEDVQHAVHGPVVSFVAWDAAGAPISSHSVRDMLAAARIIVRAGCCCNPGACAAVLGLTDGDVLRNIQEGWSCGGDVGVVGGRHTGVVRVSLGTMSTAADMHALLAALRESILELGRSSSIGTSDACCDTDDSSCTGTEKNGFADRGSIEAQAMPGLCLTDTACHAVENCAELANGSNMPADGDTGDSDGREGAVGVAAEQAGRGGVVRVAALWVYPVKSMRGQQVLCWPVGAAGMLMDRAWALTDRAGRVLSCAHYPRLLLMSAMVDLSARTLKLTWRGGDAGRDRATAVQGDGLVAKNGVASQDAVLIAWPACMCQDWGSRDMGGAVQRCCEQYAVKGWEAGRGGEACGPSVNVHAWVSKRLGMDAFVMHQCRAEETQDRQTVSAQAACRSSSEGGAPAGCQLRSQLPVDGVAPSDSTRCSGSVRQSDHKQHACRQQPPVQSAKLEVIAGRPVLGQVAVGMACRCVHEGAAELPPSQAATMHGACASAGTGGSDASGSPALQLRPRQGQAHGGGVRAARSLANKGPLLVASLASVQRAAGLLAECDDGAAHAAGAAQHAAAAPAVWGGCSPAAAQQPAETRQLGTRRDAETEGMVEAAAAPGRTSVTLSSA
eukprot:jgi/Ulvmu1/206/UM001_0210.1